MILKFEGYMLPIMKLCLDGKTRKSRDLYSVADLCGITDEEKLESECLIKVSKIIIEIMDAFEGFSYFMDDE